MVKLRRSLLALALVTSVLVATAPSAPASAVAASMPASIAQGTTHTCTLDTTGSVWCAGSNIYGQLGDATNNNSFIPTRALGGPFTSIYAAGLSTCALTSGGVAWCWGQNTYGQLGDGTTTDRNVPTRISGYTFTSIAMTMTSTCGLITGGYAYCWGANNYGQVGNNDATLTNVSVPTAVYNTLWTYKQISAGYSHTCAIRSDDLAYCWGWNVHGMLGVGNNANRLAPTAVTGGYTFKQITASFRSTCGIRTDDLIYCWGSQINGQLGDGVTGSGSYSYNPVAATNTVGYGYQSLVSGENYYCGVLANGTLSCWGAEISGQLGDNVTSTTYVSPFVAFGGHTVVAIGHNYNNTMCVITALGTVECSGVNSSGQYGNGNGSTYKVPTQAKFILAQLGASASVAIDPSFSFTVASRATACNGQLATLVTSTPTAVDLGHLNASSLSGGAHDLSVASNAGNGGVVYLRSALATRNLVGTSGSIADSGATAPIAGTESFGYSTSDSNRGLASNTFATLTNVNAEVAYSASGSISPAQCVGYQVAVSSLTPAGQYAATIIYTAVPSF